MNNSPATNDHRITLTLADLRALLRPLQDSDNVSVSSANWLVFREREYIGLVDFWSQEEPFLDLEASNDE